MKTRGSQETGQVSRPDEAPGVVEADPATGGVNLRFPVEDQLKFGNAIVSDGLVTTAQLDLAIQHTRSIGVPIGQSLIHIGAITQRQLMMFLEQL